MLNVYSALLELFAQTTSRKEYLDAVVVLIHNWSRCRCVGIRILDEEGNIPYESYLGFCKEFWESENRLSINQDQSACIRVITGKMEPQDAPFMTAAGSFRCDNTNRLLSELSEQELAGFRGTCIRYGFASVAVIPIRCRDKVMGAVYLADEMEGKVPLKSVEFIESMTPLIGEALHERRRMEEALRLAHQQLQDIIEFLPDATFVIDSNRKVIAWNRAMEEMTGVRKEDILGKGDFIYSIEFYGEKIPMLIDLVGLDDKEAETRYGKIEKKGNSIYIESFLPAAYKGRGAYLWAAATPLYDSSGNIVGAIESIRDITDRKKAEAALIEANNKAARAERMALLGTMAAGIAHEITQPLNSLKIIIDGMLYLIKKGRTFTFEEIVEELEEMSAQVNRVDRIIKRMRSFVRRENSSELAPCDLNSVLEGALNMLDNQLSSVGIVVKKFLLSTIPPVLANSYRLEEVVINLIVNAMQALEKAGKKDKEINISTFVEERKHVILEVNDNATGVPDEIKNKIFEPFFTTKEVGEGMGLGLSIAYSIVTSYNGQINVKTNERGGATFRVEFPVFN